MTKDLLLPGGQEWYYFDNGHGIPQWATLDHMSQTFDRIQRRLGIEGVKPFHGFRAYVATQLLQNGVDVSMVRDIRRHRELTTTLSFLNRSKMPYLNAVNKLPGSKVKPSRSYTLVLQNQKKE